ncbi:ECF RNA polymerase sigma factor SigK [Nonomuraea sp. NPDC050394]|uniref:ECF RNA polymerase sigma factor SigK n=1 Tax=Nonomuraea sp. NPDC050394 TaxID=3364363 RepID=UPI0037A9DC37
MTNSRERNDPDQHRTGPGTAPTVQELLRQSGRGDRDAFARLYDQVAGVLYGLVLRVVRDRGQSEEVVQEVLLEIWRQAPRYDGSRGGAMAWMTTIAHRRAVDRVRSAQAGADREAAAGRREAAGGDYDTVAEAVEDRLERERVRRCLDGLTDLQHQAVTLAFYGGHSYPEVAQLLATPLGTIKTRMRDGLIRLRDCLGVAT